MGSYLHFSYFLAVLDIVLVAFILYWMMLFLKGTRAQRMIGGIVIIVILYFVSQRAELLTLHWLLSNFLGSIIIVIIVVFQQDIRRALMQMGRPFSSGGQIMDRGFLDELSSAVSTMSEERTGALIAIEREVDLTEFVEGGVGIDSWVSKDLLLSIFNPDSPIHDGAVIIRRQRLSKAGAILPLTEKELTSSMGTRHRAALGLSEETDSVIVVVSEKSGEISIATEGSFEKGFDYESLLLRLKDVLISGSEPKRSFFQWKGMSK
ncbi:MAG: TIGR00159 family protein [Proteobacteria bacterium]|nr:TIGR00159 family protein [Pseudomonadota bacterium]